MIEDHEHTMLRNVFPPRRTQPGLPDGAARLITYLDLSLPLEVNLQRLVEYRHSFFPVCDGSLSDLVGILNVSKVLHAYIKGEPIDLALTQDGSLLPETLNGLGCSTLPYPPEHMVLVVDEYGGLRGLVTPAGSAGNPGRRLPAGRWGGQLGLPARRRLAARRPHSLPG